MLRRNVVVTMLLAIIAGPVNAAAPPPAAVPAASFAAMTPHVLPFATRADWLAFVGGTSGGGAAAEHYAAVFSAADYADAASSVATRAHRITYRSGGLRVNGLMVAPRTPGPHPVIVFNHGGVMQWGRIIVPEILEFHRLAARGYIVLASNYRGEGGSEGAPSMDGGDVEDVLALLALVPKLLGADPGRIGMWGFSRGGLVTYGVLARTDRIKAAIIIGGPTDLANAPRRAEFDEFVYPFVIGGYAKNKDAALARLSPINWPATLAPATPLLLLHGGDDPRVATSDSLRMGEALQGLQRSYRLKVYEGGSHDLVENWSDVRAEIDRWLDLYLKRAGNPPRNGVTVLPAVD
jgi:dipeptidyl aminopeptidase/acylaminoacyl peptidase